jgi:tyrosyl-DNA phosphodiesterase 2
MPDTVVQLRGKQFSGQWVDAPLTPCDGDIPDDLPASLTLVTWNVDFSKPYATQRLTAALGHLEVKLTDDKGGKPPPCLILLQEIRDGAFDTLLAHPWVREWFMVVPGDPTEGWPQDARYGTVTLIARSMKLTASTCVHFEESWMHRNALVTDVMLGGAEGHARVLRVINTHLESLPMGTPRRVVQLKVIAELLEQGKTESGGVGGIVGGDMNAIAPSDATLPEQNGLLDAWEEKRRRDGEGGEDKDEDGMTWGYQPPCQYPPGRLDKILYTSSDVFEVRDIRRLGINERVSLPEDKSEWVSDHYGLLCQVDARQEAEA